MHNPLTNYLNWGVGLIMFSINHTKQTPLTFNSRVQKAIKLWITTKKGVLLLKNSVMKHFIDFGTQYVGGSYIGRINGCSFKVSQEK